MAEAQEGLVYLADMGGRNLYSSPALYAFTGRVAGSAAGDGWHQSIHPDDIEYARAFFADVQGRKQSFAGWWRIRKHDGTFPWSMIGGMPFISEITGVPIGYLGSIHPLARPDAFERAGGVMGPELGCRTSPRDNLPRVEKIADLTLMASAMARESGETDIAAALDAALLKIGFRLAEFMKRPPAAPAPCPPATAKARRRVAARG